ncbi:MAG: trypsin-like peptidase domain-containing protein [bacterium]|nr:trypsin-like peptidase domain-containing protein [Candidatus Jorgensenbacteria bacterium]
MRRENSRIVKTVRNVMPAVVSIALTKPLDELKKEFDGIKRKPKNARFSIPAEKIDARGMVDVGGGSGFIVDKSGIILTNRHVIDEDGVEYSVTTSDGRKFSAKLLARDPVDDVAILKIESEKKLPYVDLGDSSDIELGQRALAFGNALGIFKDTVSMGIISGLSRAVSAHGDPKAPMQEMRGLIQTDAAINPGNSGGPLVTIYGDVIGINAAIVSGAENISFAIPINSAKRDLNDLKKYGRIRRPLLGVRYLILNEDFKEKMNLSVSYGALITKEHPMDIAVVEASPAADADLRENDIILSWNNEDVVSNKSIQDFLENSNVGDVIKLSVLRGEKMLDKEVTLTERN